VYTLTSGQRVQRGLSVQFSSGTFEQDSPGIDNYNVSLLPRTYFGQQVPATLSEDDRERGEDVASGWWASHPPSARFLTALRSLLPIDKSWDETEEFVSAGDWSSDIRIWKDAGRVSSITFRFSPVSDRWSLMQQFLTVARDEQCLLLEESSGAVIAPDEGIVRKRLAASRAVQFVRDPAGTIIQAARELKDDAG
jgi:hypothetical protein